MSFLGAFGTVTEAGRLIGAEWRALGDVEQQAYKDEAAQDRG